MSGLEPKDLTELKEELERLHRGLTRKRKLAGLDRTRASSLLRLALAFMAFRLEQSSYDDFFRVATDTQKVVPIKEVERLEDLIIEAMKGLSPDGQRDFYLTCLKVYKVNGGEHAEQEAVAL